MHFKNSFNLFNLIILEPKLKYVYLHLHTTLSQKCWNTTNLLLKTNNLQGVCETLAKKVGVERKVVGELLQWRLCFRRN